MAKEFFRVKAGGSIIDGRGRQHVGPSRIDGDTLTPAQIEEHLRSGYLVRVRDYNPEADAQEQAESAPGINAPAIRDDADKGLTVVGRDAAGNVTQRVTGAPGTVVQDGVPGRVAVAGSPDNPVTVVGGAGADPTATVTPGARVDDSPWVIDPATLEGKSLEQLNVQVADIARNTGAKIEPFEDAAEARAFLSKDRK